MRTWRAALIWAGLVIVVAVGAAFAQDPRIAQAMALLDVEDFDAAEGLAQAALAEAPDIDCLLYTSPSPRDRG